MIAEKNSMASLEAEAEVAKGRLLSVKGDPFVFAAWERVAFLHFALPAKTLRPQVPAPFELELHEGGGIVSLVALTMRRFRPVRIGAGWGMRMLREQRFLNLRTYVRCHGEPGALFLWGWLSRPFGLPLPRGFGLPFAFAKATYIHEPGKRSIEGEVTEGNGRLAYRGAACDGARAEHCAPGSVEAFALERYTGYFSRGSAPFVFRAWHPPWLQIPIDVKVEDTSLVTNRFPWFREGHLAAANFAPGFDTVWLGNAHRVESQRRHHRLSVFYEMP